MIPAVVMALLLAAGDAEVATLGVFRLEQDVASGVGATVEIEKVTPMAKARPEAFWIMEKAEPYWIAEKRVQAPSKEVFQWADSRSCAAFAPVLTALSDGSAKGDPAPGAPRGRRVETALKALAPCWSDTPPILN